ncbi:aminoacyl-tRNA hydrolase [Leptolyngbya sp. 'hensonii']|uniref:aminoacyl-tRNA hydrolase n=1 Tax=Leptolyngbya sp. 'hensonii' TaxID=1922337 RepID=UPI00094FE37B|nr:aminoacyl-tRNA hydrolase [Leptolyngbya sp. 'hensonii']OLP17571.1 aminoacyl-tRNA hydrolase [Leptolyngbya sp. 'hensonii']
MTDASPPPLPVMPQLIVGLGNPGSKYEQTRHNVGFAVIDALARSWQISLTENRKFQGLFGEGLGPQAHKIRLLKPLTFMNASGQSMRAVVDWFKLEPQSVLVIYDDMDLPIGKIRLRLSGSAGGHNGMKSAIAHLGTQNFPRLRVGIGSPKSPVSQAEKDAISHVLGQFSVAESKLLPEILRLVEEVLEMSLKQGIEKAMSLYNNRSLEPSQD